MRIVAEIPHPQLKITVFSWNGKYLIKLEIDRYEQTYKIDEGDVDSLQQVKDMITDEFIENCMQRFLKMREDFINAYK